MLVLQMDGYPDIQKEIISPKHNEVRCKNGTEARIIVTNIVLL